MNTFSFLLRYVDIMLYIVSFCNLSILFESMYDIMFDESYYQIASSGSLQVGLEFLLCNITCILYFVPLSLATASGINRQVIWPK